MSTTPEQPYRPRLLVFAGSTRSASFNKMLARAAAEALARAGAETTYIDLRDYPMPLYDGDLEESAGLPEPARKLKALMAAQDGFLIAAPEYNSSITAVLKNTLDWVSRAEADDEPPMLAFDGKTAALVSASPGALGGMRGLVTVRQILVNAGVLVLPEQLSLPRAHEAFDENGRLRDPRRATALTGIAERLVDVTARLRA